MSKFEMAEQSQSYEKGAGYERSASGSAYAAIAAGAWSQEEMRVLRGMGGKGLTSGHFGTLEISGVNADGSAYRGARADAAQAQAEAPALGDGVRSGVYQSGTKLNVQITQVPEVSAPVKVGEFFNYVGHVMEAGAQAVRQVEAHLAQPNAINRDLTDGMRKLSANHIDMNVGMVAGEAVGKAVGALRKSIDSVAEVIDKPLPVESRAKLAGVLVPLFFLDTPSGKQPLDSRVVKQLNLESNSAEELGRLGINRGELLEGSVAVDGVISRKSGLEVVEQLRKTLRVNCADIDRRNIGFVELNVDGKSTTMVAVNGAEAPAGTVAMAQHPVLNSSRSELTTARPDVLLRDRDAQHKLLEAIAQNLPRDARGTIAMFVEDRPWGASAQRAVAEFKQKFPGIKFEEPSYAYENKTERLRANLGAK